MNGAFLAGFGDGVFRGINQRKSWEQQKLDQDRAKKRDEYLAAAEGRAAEQFGWLRDKHKSDQQSESEIKAAQKAAWDEADAAAAASAASSAPVDPATGVAPLGAVQPEPPATPGRMPQPGDITSAPLPPMPGQSLGATPDQRRMDQDAPHSVRSGPSVTQSAPVSQEPAAAPAVSGIDPNASAFRQQLQGISRDADIDKQLSTITTGLATGQYGPSGSMAGRVVGAVGDYFTATPEQGKTNAAARGETSAAISWFQSDSARQHFVDNPQDLQVASKDPVGFAKKMAGALPAQTPGSTPPATPVAQPGAPSPVAAPVVAPGGSADVAAAARSALDATSSDAAATVASATEGKGATRAVQMTDDQRNRGSKDVMDYYRKNGAPKVIRAMLKNGDIKGATDFQEWLDKSTTRAGMDSWAKATVAASVGDFDGFANHIAEAYNRLDYFGDDTTIVKEKSGFTDANGKIVTGNPDAISGAKITFRDEKTGNTFEQTYDNPDDLVRMGITLLAPEEAFAWHQKNMEAAQTAGVTAAKTAKADAADRQKIIQDTFKALSEEDLTFGSLPDAEKMKRVQARLALIDSSGSLGALPGAGGPPVAYRN